METDIVIDVWFHRYENGRDIEGRFDYNSWQESDTGRKLVKKLDKDVVLAEGIYTIPPYQDPRREITGLTCAGCILGYKEYKTERTYMALMGNWRENNHVEIPLDGIGGVNILVKADVHRSGAFSLHPPLTFKPFIPNPARIGINFPCYAFENQAETEGFAKMAKRAGYGVYGLPNYVVWHVDTQEKPGNAA